MEKQRELEFEGILERERREERERGGGGLGAKNWFSLLFKKKVLIFVSRRERDE